LSSVDHPAHYGGRDSTYETIKIIEAMGWGEGFCAGNALKYMTRAGSKPGAAKAEDLAKAEWYIRWWRELVERSNDGRD
jgi:hypothetical protein